MVLKKEKTRELPAVQLSKWNLLKGALAALLVRLVFYFLVSVLFIALLSWAGLSVFSLKYVLVLMAGLFFFYVMFGNFAARY